MFAESDLVPSRLFSSTCFARGSALWSTWSRHGKELHRMGGTRECLIEKSPPESSRPMADTGI